MKRVLTRGKWWIITLCCTVTIISCNKKDPVPEEITENRRVNDWILVNMEREYYWNDEIPAEPNMNQDPMDFFESILSDKDRFSWIQESGEELSDNLSGKFESFGYEVKLYYRFEPADDRDDQIDAVVLYTYEGSDAAAEGLERGAWIGKVNGQDLMESNYMELLFDTQEPQELAIGEIDNEGNFTTEEVITVQAREIQENPVHYNNIYNIGGKTIGYVVYNSFIPSPAGDTSGVYDLALQNIFSEFEAQGVNELVLDLRYNLGGSVASAFKLGGYIMKGYQEDNLFAMYEDNMERFTPIPVGFFYEVESPPNLGMLNRVHVLISTNTASASELIINGLKPYMEVILIGDDRTVGKNVASITITDTRRNVPKSERINYGLQPIVYKIYNSLMESDFEQGFEPDIEVRENFAPFGDLNESFLSAALNAIAGVAVTTESLKSAAPDYAPLGSSLSRKPGAGEMYVKPGEIPQGN